MNTYNAFTTLMISVSSNDVSASSPAQAESCFLEKLQAFSESINSFQNELVTETIHFDECEVAENVRSTQPSSNYTSMKSLLVAPPSVTPTRRNQNGNYTPLTRT